MASFWRRLHGTPPTLLASRHLRVYTFFKLMKKKLKKQLKKLTAGCGSASRRLYAYVKRDNHCAEFLRRFVGVVCCCWCCVCCLSNFRLHLRAVLVIAALQSICASAVVVNIISSAYASDDDVHRGGRAEGRVASFLALSAIGPVEGGVALRRVAPLEEVEVLARARRQDDVALGPLDHGDPIAFAVVVRGLNDASHAEAAIDAFPPRGDARTNEPVRVAAVDARLRVSPPRVLRSRLGGPGQHKGAKFSTFKAHIFGPSFHSVSELICWDE